MYGYLNFVMLGTSAGARFCETLNANDPSGNAGDLRMGSIIPNIIQPVTKPVRCFTGQNQFVWFGWSAFDTTSTGLGRMDLTNFVAEFTPAYASDLMVTSQAEVISMDWFGAGTTFNGNMTPTNGPVFVVKGVGVYGPASTYVASGYVDGGYYTYNIPDQKIGMFYDVKPSQPMPTGTSFSGSIAIDQGAFQPLGGISAGGSIYALPVPQLEGEYLEPMVTLATTNTANTPTILRTTLKAWPAVVCSEEISLVLLLWEQVEVNDQQRFIDPYDALQFIRSLWQSQQVVLYQEGPISVNVVVDEYDWLPHARRDDQDGGFQGNLIVYLKTLSG
jgi:hypothetical protein